MGSLQEQLLKAGLVSEQKLKETRSGKRKQRKRQRAGQPVQDDAADLAKAYAERAREEQRERDRELNRKREEERRRREINAQLRQLVLPNARNDAKGELPRHFEHAGKIRKLYVTQPQLDALGSGALGIAYLQGRYYLLEAAALQKVRALRAEAVAFDAAEEEGGAGDEADEAYADPRFQVPDDLIW